MAINIQKQFRKGFIYTPTPNPYPLPNYLFLVPNCATFFWCVYDFLAIGQLLRCPTFVACSSTTLDTCTVSSGMAISLCRVGKEQSTLLLLVSKQTILFFRSLNIPCYSGSSFLVHVRLSFAHSLSVPSLGALPYFLVLCGSLLFQHTCIVVAKSPYSVWELQLHSCISGKSGFSLLCYI